MAEADPRAMAKRRKLTGGDGWSLERTCPRCGDAESRCACSSNDAGCSSRIVRLRLEKRRGKPVTVLEAESESDTFRDVVKDLKSRLGTGGTVKRKVGEIQGDHREPARSALHEAGFEVRG